jgi:hypothetical protein
VKKVLLLFLIVGVVIGFNQSEEKLSLIQKVKVEKIPIETKKMVQRIPAVKKKEVPQSLIEDFPQVEVSLFDSPVLFIEGVRGTFREVPGASLLKKSGGFYFYSGEIEKSSDVVYDPKRKAFGIFTGEVILRGSYEAAHEFLQKKGFEILYQNEAMQNIIFKVTSFEELKDLDELKELTKGSIQADIKFSRLSSR